jgi:transcription elongation factor GreA
MADNVNKMNQAQYDKMKAELDKLRGQGRADIAEKIANARSYGDLSENSEYQGAKEEQQRLEAKISDLEETLANAEIVDEKSIAKDVVDVNFVVKVKYLSDGFTDTYHIVSTQIADPLQNMISDRSPIGGALIGHKTGDVVTAETPTGNVKLEILDVKMVEG